MANADETATEDMKTTFIKREISLGNVLLFVGMLGTLAAGVWQGGMIRASLEDGIKAERTLRETEMTSINTRLTDLGSDVRELRGIIIAERHTP